MASIVTQVDRQMAYTIVARPAIRRSNPNIWPMLLWMVWLEPTKFNERNMLRSLDVSIMKAEHDPNRRESWTMVLNSGVHKLATDEAACTHC